MFKIIVSGGEVSITLSSKETEHLANALAAYVSEYGDLDGPEEAQEFWALFLNELGNNGFGLKWNK